MAQTDVLDYIRKTPHNSNVNVVKGMLQNNSEENNDWSTAEIEFFGNAAFELIAPVLIEGVEDEEQTLISTGGSGAITYPDITPILKVILFQSKALINIITEATITVTGKIEYMGSAYTGSDYYMVTGDGTITFS